MDHNLSPPPSPPNSVAVVAASKLLNHSNLMNGLDKLNVTMSPSSIIQRANLNTVLRNKINRGN